MCRTVLLLQVVPKRIMMSQTRTLQTKTCYQIFMLRFFVTWVLRYAAQTYSRFDHPWHIKMSAASGTPWALLAFKFTLFNFAFAFRPINHDRKATACCLVCTQCGQRWIPQDLHTKKYVPDKFCMNHWVIKTTFTKATQVFSATCQTKLRITHVN